MLNWAEAPKFALQIPSLDIEAQAADKKRAEGIAANLGVFVGLEVFLEPCGEEMLGSFDAFLLCPVACLEPGLSWRVWVVGVVGGEGREERGDRVD